MKHLFIALLISGLCFGQNPSAKTMEDFQREQGVRMKMKDSLPPKPDSATIVLNELAQFAYDKVSAKDFDILKNIVQAFLKSKEFDKPKRK